MTAPEDPFRTPGPGSPPVQPPEYGTPGSDGQQGRPGQGHTEPHDRLYEQGSYGDGTSGGSPTSPQYGGQEQYGSQQPGGPQQPGQQPGSQPYGSQPYADQQYGGQQYGGQQYGGQQYGAPPYGGVQQGQYGHGGRALRNGFGVAALVLGILALLTGLFVIGGLLGIAAIVLGILGRGRVKRGEANNGGMAIAGIVLGVLGLLLAGLVLAGVAAFFNSEEFSSIRECLSSAGSDVEAQEQCRRDFQEQQSS